MVYIDGDRLTLGLEIATSAKRNQVMGHTNSSLYGKFYQNRVVSIDISAAFLKMPSGLKKLVARVCWSYRY